MFRIKYLLTDPYNENRYETQIIEGDNNDIKLLGIVENCLDLTNKLEIDERWDNDELEFGIYTDYYYFDELQTVEQIIEWEKERREKIKKLKAKTAKIKEKTLVAKAAIREIKEIEENNYFDKNEFLPPIINNPDAMLFNIFCEYYIDKIGVPATSKEDLHDGSNYHSFLWLGDDFEKYIKAKVRKKVENLTPEQLLEIVEEFDYEGYDSMRYDFYYERIAMHVESKEELLKKVSAVAEEENWDVVESTSDRWWRFIKKRDRSDEPDYEDDFDGHGVSFYYDGPGTYIITTEQDGAYDGYRQIETAEDAIWECLYSRMENNAEGKVEFFNFILSV